MGGNNGNNGRKRRRRLLPPNGLELAYRDWRFVEEYCRDGDPQGAALSAKVQKIGKRTSFTKRLKLLRVRLTRAINLTLRL